VFRESAMQMFAYVVLAVVIYAVLADRTERAIDREMKKRRAEAADMDMPERSPAASHAKPIRSTLRSV